MIERFEAWWKIANKSLELFVENVEKDRCVGSIFGNQFHLLLMQPDNSFNRLSSFVAATEASMRFSAVLPAIACSSQPVPCSDSNSNSNDITNMTSIENT